MAPTRKLRQELPKRVSERLQLAEAVSKSKEDAASKGVTKRKRFRRPQQRKSCHFLNLPGELRNEIYAHATVNNDAISITPKGPGEPPLLRVSKRIRTEASSIYYTTNAFKLTITDFDGAALTPFSRQHFRHTWLRNTGPQHIQLLITGKPNWANMVRWIKDLHSGASKMQPNFDPPADRDDYIVGAAFRMADLLEWQPWGVVEKALENLLHGLKGTCSVWADVANGH